MTLKEAHILTLRVLKQVMEEKLDHHNVQLAQVRQHVRFLRSLLKGSMLQVTPEKGFEILDEVRLKALIDDM
jgi:20S proteasome subunit alpha 5